MKVTAIFSADIVAAGLMAELEEFFTSVRENVDYYDTAVGSWVRTPTGQKPGGHVSVVNGDIAYRYRTCNDNEFHIVLKKDGDVIWKYVGRRHAHTFPVVGMDEVAHLAKVEMYVSETPDAPWWGHPSTAQKEARGYYEVVDKDGNVRQARLELRFDPRKRAYICKRVPR